MSKICCRIAGLAAVLAVVLAPSAMAVTPPLPGPGASRQAKQRAYGKHCPAVRSAAGSRAHARCLDAMARLATGRATTPSRACRGLSTRKARGERRSAYARCVRAGAKLLNGKAGKPGKAGKAGKDKSSRDDESAAEDDDGPGGADDPDPVDPPDTDDAGAGAGGPDLDPGEDDIDDPIPADLDDE